MQFLRRTLSLNRTTSAGDSSKKVFMATLKLIRASLILSGEKLNSQFIFKNQLNCSSLNGSLQILSNMGRGFIGYTPKHASKLFKLDMRSLPLQDRFLSHLPLPPCFQCAKMVQTHLHITQCDLASQAWSLVSNQSGLQLGGLTEGLVEAWVSKQDFTKSYALCCCNSSWVVVV